MTGATERRCVFGPGTHITLTSKLLGRLERIPRPNADEKTVLAHGDHFFYGNIAADIINLKHYGGVKNHCHNWNIHERFERLVSSETERAFMLGYLCHLAADVTAHNHFVPFHRVHRLPPRYLGHPYWEALADGIVTDAEWNIVSRIKKNRILSRNDRLVHRAVRWKALGMRSNKWIFNNILLLNLRRSWREAIRAAHARRKRYPLQQDFVGTCQERCLADMAAVFEPRSLLILKLRDPTGRTALRWATRIRRELRSSYGDMARARQASETLAQAAFGVPGQYPAPGEILP